MKNLIDLNEEKKTTSQVINGNYACGWNDCIDYLQDQYNIITAPKSIMLSEVVSRLNECDKSNKFKKIIKTYETTVIENTEFKKEYFYIKNNKMFDLSDHMIRDEYKWLYTLWIADTIIEDDLKESD